MYHVLHHVYKWNALHMFILCIRNVKRSAAESNSLSSNLIPKASTPKHKFTTTNVTRVT